jgi:hypothetical protein
VFVFALAVRLVLIHIHPEIFGGDTVLRLANRDRILLAYQLPLLQGAIFAISRISDGILAVRYFMALTGAVATLGFYRLCGDFLDSRAALPAALLFASNPFLIQLSIVPYQEVPMLAALLFAFHFFFAGKTRAASACLGIACLTRYEAWAAAPVLAVAHYARGNRAPRQLLKALALFGWAPAAWVLVHHGFSAPGTFVVEAPKSIFRLVRFVYLGWITLKNTPAPVLLLSVWGAIALWKRGLRKHRALAVPLSFFLLFAAAILFSAHGESPDPERFVTAREAHMTITAAVFLAAFALAKSGRAGRLLAIAGVVWGVYDASRFVARDTAQPSVRLSYELARYLDTAVRPTEHVAMLVKPIPEQLVRDYLEKVRSAAGEEGLIRARRILASVDTSPPDFQRTRVHSAHPARLLSFAPRAGLQPAEERTAAPSPAWVVVWSDHTPGNAREAQLRAQAVETGRLIRVFRAGSLSVEIYRLP